MSILAIPEPIAQIFLTLVLAHPTWFRYAAQTTKSARPLGLAFQIGLSETLLKYAKTTQDIKDERNWWEAGMTA